MILSGFGETCVLRHVWLLSHRRAEWTCWRGFQWEQKRLQGSLGHYLISFFTRLIPAFDSENWVELSWAKLANPPRMRQITPPCLLLIKKTNKSHRFRNPPVCPGGVINPMCRLIPYYPVKPDEHYNLFNRLAEKNRIRKHNHVTAATKHVGSDERPGRISCCYGAVEFSNLIGHNVCIIFVEQHD